MTFSVSSIIATIEHEFQTVEADVWNTVIQIQSGLAVLESDVKAGLEWVAAQAPTWVADLASVVAVASVIPGLQIPAAAIEATTAAAAALSAVSAAESAGATTPQTLVAAYSAIVGAVNAKSAVQSVVTSHVPVVTAVVAKAA